ncbi:MAG: hypothetical protein WCL14_01775 [Bacteroidota bacterium]
MSEKYLIRRGKLYMVTGRNMANVKGIYLLAVPTPENVITGLLGIPKAMKSRDERAKEIIDACATNSWETILPANTILYRANLALFTAAPTAAARKATWKVVYLNMKTLLSVFQLGANANQPNAILILESGTFKIKGVSKRQKQVFTVSNTEVSGTILMVGPAGSRNSCHDWHISIDGGLTYKREQPTKDSDTSAVGLVVGMKVYFRHQLIVGKKPFGPLETRFITVT